MIEKVKEPAELSFIGLALVMLERCEPPKVVYHSSDLVLPQRADRAGRRTRVRDVWIPYARSELPLSDSKMGLGSLRLAPGPMWSGIGMGKASYGRRSERGLRRGAEDGDRREPPAGPGRLRRPLEIL